MAFPSYSALGLETTGLLSFRLPKRWGQSEVDSEKNGSSLCLANRGSDRTTSCLVVTKTNLILSCSLAHAEGGMVFTGYESASLSDR